MTRDEAKNSFRQRMMDCTGGKKTQRNEYNDEIAVEKNDSETFISRKMDHASKYTIAELK